MIYRYAKKTNYAHLAAGSVIRSYPGHTNFPVRLGHEIFHRCLALRQKMEPVTVYDPMCGTGYWLTTLALLNRDWIKALYGSDVDEKALEVAEKNLRLLTRGGVAQRRAELQEQWAVSGRVAYQDSLAHLAAFEGGREVPYTLTVQDFFAPEEVQPVSADVVLMDLPYEQLKNFAGAYRPERLWERLLELIGQGSIVAVVRPKTYALSGALTVFRQGKFKVGHRSITIYRQ